MQLYAVLCCFIEKSYVLGPQKMKSILFFSEFSTNIENIIHNLKFIYDSVRE